MDAIQDELFGQAPRRVGTPEQHWVFSPGQVDHFIDSVDGRRNAYATLGWWDFDNIRDTDRGREAPPVCDKVLFDLDSPAKSDKDGEDWAVFDHDPPDDEVVEWMRNDPDLADEILGQVCEDARKLTRRSRNDNVPVVGVYSGFGIHVHQLYQPLQDPVVAMSTTANRYIDRLNLQTPDREILGQQERICRIPNCERIAGSVIDHRVTDGRSCNLVTIPLTASELASVTVEWLLEQSHKARSIAPPDHAERPEMRVWDDYETGKEDVADVPPRPMGDGDTSIGEDDDLRWLFERLLRMPCLVERILDDPNPDHDVRVYATIQLLNTGLTPQTVVNLYSRINWIDYDREETMKHVRSIYRNGYSDKSCQTLRAKGICTRSESPEDCPTFGWSHGQCEWKQ